LASSRTLAASLAAVIGTLACGAADSHSSASGPRLAVVVGRTLGSESSAIDGRVRIEARFRTATSGTFEAGGAISDKGSLKAVRRVAGGRLQLTETLTGKLGTIRIRVTRPCAGGSGTWRVLSGSGAYKGLSGGGAASGGPRCAATPYPVRATYTGPVRTPPAPSPLPLADPGRYGGGTSQRAEVVFDVEPGGRTIAGLRFTVMTPCTGPTALSTSQVRITLEAPLEIEQDRSFAVRSEGRAGTFTVAGRFTSQTRAEGTAAASTSITVTSTNTTYPCSASVSWSASLPPPAAVPGTYCGFTLQGPGVCLDVAPSGREVSHVEVSVVVRCQPSSEFEIRLRYTGIPIGGHLGFSGRLASLEGFISGTASVSGLLDPAGADASGSASVNQPSFDYEGTRYQCFFASARWTAKRQL
jgi:hypothetical protein